MKPEISHSVRTKNGVKSTPFRYFKTIPQIIRLTLLMYIRFPRSLRNVEDLLHTRGVDVSNETIRFWRTRLAIYFLRRFGGNVSII